jgi:hypothetical protein
LQQRLHCLLRPAGLEQHDAQGVLHLGELHLVTLLTVNLRGHLQRGDGFIGVFQATVYLAQVQVAAGNAFLVARFFAQVQGLQAVFQRAVVLAHGAVAIADVVVESGAHRGVQ